MLAKIVIVGWTLFLAYTFFTGLGDVLDKNPSDNMFLAALVFSALVHLVLWAVVSVPILALSWLFRKQLPVTAS